MEQPERPELINRLMEKADQAIRSAQQVHAAGDIGLASNRVYDAGVYALSAVLLAEPIEFARHGSVRAVLHQRLVKTGRVSREFGRFYDTVFSERQQADYSALAHFGIVIVAKRLDQARIFVVRMRGFLPSPFSA